MPNLIKKVAGRSLRQILRPLGYEVRRKPKWNRLTKGVSLALLKRLGLDPRTVIDVGVGPLGTPELYEVFPNALQVLVEPVEEYAQEILKLCESIKHWELIRAAASNRTGRFHLSVSENMAHSSLGEIRDQGWDVRRMREVEVLRLDELCRNKRFPSPYLIKVDVDGKDLEVLEGASGILEETDCIVIESGVADVSLRAHFLERQGFFLWDIVDLGYKADVLFQMDLVLLHNRYKNKTTLPWIDNLELLLYRNLEPPAC